MTKLFGYAETLEQFVAFLLIRRLSGRSLLNKLVAQSQCCLTITEIVANQLAVYIYNIHMMLL